MRSFDLNLGRIKTLKNAGTNKRISIFINKYEVQRL